MIGFFRQQTGETSTISSNAWQQLRCSTPSTTENRAGGINTVKMPSSHHSNTSNDRWQGAAGRTTGCRKWILFDTSKAESPRKSR